MTPSPRAGGPGAPSRDGALDTRLDELVAAAVAGDRGAVEELLRVIRPLIVRYCRTRLGGYERAQGSPDDVAQEVCLAVLRALPGYREQGRPFLAFVYGIAGHKVVDAHRSVGRDRSEPTDELPEEIDERDGPEQAAVHLSESRGMRELLDQLPAKQREVLVMRVVVGLSAEETAAAVGSTPGAVRVAQHRALGKLRQLLEARGGGDDAAGPVPRRPVRADDDPPRRGRRGRPGPPIAGAPVADSPAVGSPAVGSPAPLEVAAAASASPRDELTWDRAPRTGDPVLDELLDRADAHVNELVMAGAGAPGGPSLVAPPATRERHVARERALAVEDAWMVEAARGFRDAPPA